MGDFNQDADVNKKYDCSAEFKDKAYVKSVKEYEAMYKASIADPSAFWGEIGKKFHWQKPFSEVGPKYNFDIRKGPITTEWFIGGETNIAYNCLDAQIQQGNGDKVAYYYECNDIDDKHQSYTFQQVKDLVCQLANAFRNKGGVKRGDRVSIYLPMVVELPASMLATARIGAIHSVVFGGFSADSLASRIVDAESRVVVTSDGVMRGPKPIMLKGITDKAVGLAAAEGVKVDKVVCLKRLGDLAKCPHEWDNARDVWFSDFIGDQSKDCDPEWMGSEDPLFMLYTSGSTGKPKGVLHTTAGYMTGAYMTTKYTFDLHAEDIFFCTADCGWITGHTYICYGPMLNGITQVLFEGVPNHPDPGRFWEVCDKYKVNAFYTAPTAIRALMRFGDEPVTKHSRASLRILGTVGEPINPAAWEWYYKVVGGGKCPIADTYWQTETGSHLITPLCGAHAQKPGSACFPFFGIAPAIVDDKGNELQGECAGALVIKKPSPSMMRSVYGDHERFMKTYFSQFPGYYFTGDGCKRDKDGYYWLTGRMDDVINVSGHRIGTAEVESALVGYPGVAEAAVVGYPHDIKGEGIYCYVTLLAGETYTMELKQKLKVRVREVIGAFAQPDEIHWAPALPKTRSGKIMRRVLRKLALPSFATEDLGDTSTLADPGAVDLLKKTRPGSSEDGGCGAANGK
eukprot:gnl/MRDRNA2_/MRDRNA2_102692_c0_seq1.p1 gnl/MRDRNA2_/MRDRNA2_102692_c0~~gnl/MRDRNA2_/MRDRNA2_102692_c0_seq1.p1  ORF type:complete len:683 (-),score=145.89 gnl/MRDRNA2_/MRDRNA2_102692_c0_seq1:165-2213(-)